MYLKKRFVTLKIALTFALASGVYAQNDELDSLLDGLASDPEPKVEQKSEDAAKVEEKKEEPAPAVAEVQESAEKPVEQKQEEVKATTDEVASLLDSATEEKPAEEPKAEVKEEAVAEVKEAVETKEEAPATEEKVAEEKVEAPQAETAEVAPAETATETVEAKAEEPAPAVEEKKAEVAETKVVSPEMTAIDDIANMERLRRDALRRVAVGEFERAMQKMLDSDYDGAIEIIQRIQKDQKDFISITALRPYLAKIGLQKKAMLNGGEALDALLAEVYYRKSRMLYKQGEYKDALAAANAAYSLKHANGKRQVERCQTAYNRPQVFDNKAKTPPRIGEKDYKSARSSIRQRLNRGEQYLMSGELDKAMEEAELVLVENPYNADAMRLRKRASERRRLLADRDEREATRRNMIATVSETWNPRRTYAVDSDAVRSKRGIGSQVASVDNESAISGEKIIEKKLNDIKLPEVSFRPPATVSDAIEFFKQQSREFDDPELEASKKGVNFVLKLGTPTQGAPAANKELNPFDAATGVDDQGASTSASGPTIPNISASFISLGEALKLVCDVTGMKYIIKKNIVMVLPLNEPETDFETRTYNVVSSMIKNLTMNDASVSSSGGSFGGGGGDSNDSSSSSGDNSTETWKNFFGSMGVVWPARSSIAYIESVSKLRVTNTPENLAIFEQVLQDLNVTPRQIEIEARFVEVGQKDLNSMGFEWALNNDINLKGDYLAPAGSGTSSSGLGNITPNGGALAGSSRRAAQLKAGSFSSGMRFVNSKDASGEYLNPDFKAEDGFASFNLRLGDVDLSLILHMLSQRSDTDLLSAPKVVTRDGCEAEMKVVEEFIYPEGYDVTISQQGSSSGGNYGGGYSSGSTGEPLAIVQPTGFITRDVGVILKATPQVTQDGQMINLTLNPEVCEFKQWLEYGTRYPRSVASGEVDPITGTPIQKTEWIEVPMNQPLFHTRKASAQLSIYNGATVVLGGMITEKRQTIDDKIPFLGDLPWIGFLFRSKSEISEKRNLLIFVTARLVDPAGRAIISGGDSMSGATAGGSLVTAPAPEAQK